MRERKYQGQCIVKFGYGVRNGRGERLIEYWTSHCMSENRHGNRKTELLKNKSSSFYQDWHGEIRFK